MKKYNVYYSFNKHSDSGYAFSVVDKDADWMATHESYFFSAEIELPDVERDNVIKSGVTELDNDILALNMQIKAKKEQKQQLMALEYKGANDE